MQCHVHLVLPSIFTCSGTRLPLNLTPILMYGGHSPDEDFMGNTTLEIIPITGPILHLACIKDRSRNVGVESVDTCYILVLPIFDSF